MSVLSALGGVVIAVIFIVDVSAQELFTRRNALPIPPPPPGTAASSAALKFEASKSPEENARIQQQLSERLRNAQDHLKKIDLDRARAREAAQNLPTVSTESGRSASKTDPERSHAVREAVGWERLRASFAIESICGTSDDTQDVELYNGSLGPEVDSVLTWQSSTGQIQWNPTFDAVLGPSDDPGNVAAARWCSGTLISDRLFLTAGHCFDINSNDWITPLRRVGTNLVSLTPQELASLMHVNFNYQRDGSTCTNTAEPRTCQTRRPDSYPILRLLEHRRGNLDYAIAELGLGRDGQLPGHVYRSEPLDPSSGGLSQATLLTIIQHPNGVPKRIGAGRQLRIAGNVVFYSQIDTLGGSSGAGILDQFGRVIGIHTNGGCFIGGGENLGLVLRAVAQVSDIIRTAP